MGESSAPSTSDGCTKTTIVAETVTGSHVLDVKGYSLTKGHLGVGKSISSGVFSVADQRWILRYYPDGSYDESANHISIFLHLVEIPVANVNARFSIGLLSHDGEPLPRYTFTSIHTFSSTTTSCGYHKFIEKKQLELHYLRDDDSFQIKCDLTVFKDIGTETVALPPLPPLDLPRHLGGLLESKVGGDVEFEVDGELIMAHRYILAARSSVFMAEMFGPMATGRVRVQDMDARVFRYMLHFIYTDSLPQIDAPNKAAMAQHLLVAADRYDLQRLKLICEDMLYSSMDVILAATTLVLAEQHACQRLKAACLEFLKAPGKLKAVMATDGFQHLKNSCPCLLGELLAQVAS